MYGKPIFTKLDQNNYLKDLYIKSGVVQRNMNFFPINNSALVLKNAFNFGLVSQD